MGFAIFIFVLSQDDFSCILMDQCVVYSAAITHSPALLCVPFLPHSVLGTALRRLPRRWTDLAVRQGSGGLEQKSVGGLFPAPSLIEHCSW